MVNTDTPCKDAETAVGAQKLLSSTFGARLMVLGQLPRWHTEGQGRGVLSKACGFLLGDTGKQLYMGLCKSHASRQGEKGYRYITV